MVKLTHSLSVASAARTAALAAMSQRRKHGRKSVVCTANRITFGGSAPLHVLSSYYLCCGVSRRPLPSMDSSACTGSGTWTLALKTSRSKPPSARSRLILALALALALALTLVLAAGLAVQMPRRSLAAFVGAAVRRRRTSARLVANAPRCIEDGT